MRLHWSSTGKSSPAPVYHDWHRDPFHWQHVLVIDSRPSLLAIHTPHLDETRKVKGSSGSKERDLIASGSLVLRRKLDCFLCPLVGIALASGKSRGQLQSYSSSTSPTRRPRRRIRESVQELLRREDCSTMASKANWLRPRRLGIGCWGADFSQ